MNGSTYPRCKPALVLTVLLGGMFISTCASDTGNQVSTSMTSPAAEAPNAVAGATATTTQAVPLSAPQLIKKATLTLVVNSLDDSIQKVSDIAAQQQGDLLSLEDQEPLDSARHTLSMQLRVPQSRLDSTLKKLTQLGIVQRRSITAEDVTNQLVDYQARLTNLRKTESTLLNIMERSGSVGDVLKVAQELSNVRQSIEQIGAQLKSVQNQVAYSTITLRLEAAISTTTPQPPLGSRIQETWQTSTHSFSEFTISLLRVGIWLMVYSPYLLLLAAAAYGYTRLRKSNSPSIAQAPETPRGD